MIIEIEAENPIIQIQEEAQKVELISGAGEVIEVDVPVTVIDIVIEENEVIEIQEVGAEGPPGVPGPPGGFEIVPLALTGGMWTNVPLTQITYVVDVVVYNQINREKVELDVRINPDQTVEVKSSSTKTFNIHVSGV